MMKKLKKWNKKNCTLAGLMATTIFASVGFVTSASLLAKTNISSTTAENESATSSDTPVESSELNSTYAAVRASNNYSRRIPADVTYKTPPKPTRESNITFVNGEGRMAMEFSTDTKGNVILTIPEDIKIFSTNEVSNLKATDFDISVKTFSNAAYSFTDDGFIENALISEEHIPFRIEPNTIKTETLSGGNTNLIVIEKTEPTGKIVGNMNSGYVEVSINILNARSHYGPNSLHVAQGHEYSAFLEDESVP